MKATLPAVPPLTGGVRVQLDASRCVRARNRFADCDICTRQCPAQAIQLAGIPLLDAETCTGCGLCLHNCPSGAYSGDDGVNLLLRTVQQLGDSPAIELACHLHPAPALGPGSIDAVVRVGHCLAALGPSAYIALLAQGVKRVSVRLDACAECPLAGVRPRIEESLSAANKMASTALQSDTPLEALTALKPSEHNLRPVRDAHPKSLSRRKLFGLLTGQGLQLLASGLLPEPLSAPDSRAPSAAAPPPERRRLLASLKQIAASRPAQAGATAAEMPLLALPFVQLAAGETCSACGLCARICPTGALRFSTTEDNRYQLSFLSADCTGCDACLAVCAPGALQREGSLTLAQLLAETPMLLRAGDLQRCERCNARFAAPSGARTCEICAWRESHPFGSRPPLKRSIPSVSSRG